MNLCRRGGRKIVTPRAVEGTERVSQTQQDRHTEELTDCGQMHATCTPKPEQVPALRRESGHEFPSLTWIYLQLANSLHQRRLTGYTTHTEVLALRLAADGQHKTGLVCFWRIFFVGFFAPVLVLCLNIIFSNFVFCGCSCVGVSCLYMHKCFSCFCFVFSPLFILFYSGFLVYLPDSSLKRERKKACRVGWVERWGGSWRWGKGNCNQNTLYAKKNLFSVYNFLFFVLPLFFRFI